MMKTLHFLPELENDILAGYDWYEEKSPGLGEEYLRMFFACSHNIARYPMSYPKVHGDFRRRLLRRFPFAIYYRLEGTKIVVVGFFHCARDPRFIKTQLQDRDEASNR